MVPVFVATALGTHPVGSKAIITPAMRDSANTVLQRIRTNAYGWGDTKFGPYQPRLEVRSDAIAEEVASNSNFAGDVPIDDAINYLKTCGEVPGARRTWQWLSRQDRILGHSHISNDELTKALKHHCREVSYYSQSREYGLSAMTVHQAKNREFDGVVVLWPFEVGGDDEHKRRLLYNAVTRAKEWCVVACMSANQLESAPFTELRQ